MASSMVQVVDMGRPSDRDNGVYKNQIARVECWAICGLFIYLVRHEFNT